MIKSEPSILSGMDLSGRLARAVGDNNGKRAVLLSSIVARESSAEIVGAWRGSEGGADLRRSDSDVYGVEEQCLWTGPCGPGGGSYAFLREWWEARVLEPRSPKKRIFPAEPDAMEPALSQEESPSQGRRSGRFGTALKSSIGYDARPARSPI